MASLSSPGKRLAANSLRQAMSSNRRLEQKTMRDRAISLKKGSLLEALKKNAEENELVTKESVKFLEEKLRQEGLVETSDIREIRRQNKKFYEDQLHRFKREMKNEIDDYFNNYETNLLAIKSENDDLRSENKQLKVKNSKLQSDLDHLEEKLREEIAKNIELEPENKVLSKEREEHKKEVERFNDYSKKMNEYEKVLLDKIYELRKHVEKLAEEKRSFGPGSLGPIFTFPTARVSSSIPVHLMTDVRKPSIETKSSTSTSSTSENAKRKRKEYELFPYDSDY
jgi:hypothetical protein